MAKNVSARPFASKRPTAGEDKPLPAFHDVSRAPTRRPPTNKVFKVAIKKMREQEDGMCAKEFAALVNCVSQSSNEGTTHCDEYYKAMKACKKGAALDKAKRGGTPSSKYHVERVYAEFGSQTRKKKGKGQK